MNSEINIFGRKIKKEQIRNFIKISAKIGIILLIFISMIILSHSVLVSPDDYNFTFVQGSGVRERVDNLNSALKTAKHFYFNWTGRVLPHVFIGMFRSFPQIAYDLCNSLVFIIFVVLINKVLNKKSTFLGILSVFGYLSFSKMFGEKFAWMSGTFNYLWPSTLLVTFIYYFYNYFIDEKNLNILEKIMLVLLACVTAFSHENIAFVGGSFLLCLIGLNLKNFLKFEKNKKITVVSTFISFCLGAFATIFAPGNFTRLEKDGGGFSWRFLENYVDNKWVLITVLFSMIIVFGIQNFELLKNEKLKGIKKADYNLIKKEFLFFILPSLIATIPMAVISYFPPRAFLAYEVMFMIVFSKNVIWISEHLEEKDFCVAAISIIFSLIVFGKFSPSTLAQINYLIPYKNKITAQYEEAAIRGESDVLVSSFEFENWIHKEDLINISNFFPVLDYHMPVNALIAQYYGFNRVTAVGDDEYLFEIEVDTEGINPYYVIDKETGKNIYTMEYDNLIRYTVPKDKYGIYLLDCTENGLENKIINCRVRYVGGEKPREEINLEDIIKK